MPVANHKVTSLKLAALAGVSHSAISRVFTSGSSVSQKKALKMRAATEQSGYRPNKLARSLKSGKSRITGLGIAGLEHRFYPRRSRVALPGERVIRGSARRFGGQK